MLYILVGKEKAFFHDVFITGLSMGIIRIVFIFVDWQSKLFNSLPNDKFLDRSKLKAFADIKINVTEKNNIFSNEKPSFSGSLKVRIVWHRLNSLPNNKIVDQFNLKDFADNKISETNKMNFVMGKVENIVGKRENAGHQHFSPFPTMFSKAFFFRVVKSGL